MVSRAKHCRLQRRPFHFESGASGRREAIGRLHDNFDYELATGHARLFALPLELLYRTPDTLNCMAANAGSFVQHAIDSRIANAGLQSDLLDQERMRHGLSLMGF